MDVSKLHLWMCEVYVKNLIRECSNINNHQQATRSFLHSSFITITQGDNNKGISDDDINTRFMDLVAWINFFLSRSPIWILFSMLSTKHNKHLINFFKHSNGKNTHTLCFQTDEER